MNNDELKYRLAFASIRGMGIDLAQKILDVIPSEKEFFSLSDKDMKEITGSKSKVLEKKHRNACLEKAEKEIPFIEKNKIKVTYFTDSDFPQRALHAPDSPILLYSLGNADWNSQHIVSIVGTRRCTEYGRNKCAQIVTELAEAIPDIVTVSGLAHGIDIAAHRASIKCNIPTIAIQACGLNRIYPTEHRNDAAQIIHSGGRNVSDYMSQDVIHRGNFIARNRIIAGLSDCTIVIESAEKGGSLVTASIALSYDRDVFACPGRTSDEFSKGCNKLIQRNQAMLITCADDIINTLGWESKVKNPNYKQLSIFPELTKEEKDVVDVIKDAGDIHVNDITEKLHMPVYKVMSTLMQLDCKGVIITLPGSRYTLA